VVACGETVEGDQVFGVCRWGRVDLAQVSVVGSGQPSGLGVASRMR
jgi:hypothetical protein